MKKHLTLLLTILSVITSYAQVVFENGYFITNSGEKVDCLIKNKDWDNNPSSFQYRLSENGDIKSMTIESVEEFGITDVSKYIRSTVDIDRSSEVTKDLSKNRNPQYKKEQLFIRVLVEGQANLYEYNDKGLKRYFYNQENSEIEPLIYKSYKTDDGRVAQNVGYQQQLLNNLQCDEFNFNKFKNLKYRRKSLAPLFIDYNNCQSADIISYERKDKKDAFHINIRPGLNSSQFIVEGADGTSGNVEFDNKLTLRLGIELEYTAPFNKNKWAVLFEPTYQYYKAESMVTENFVNAATPRVTTYKIDYKSIELPLGIRHYFFLNNNSKFFINGSVIFDFNLNSTFTINGSDNFTNLKTITSCFGIGGGYKYNDKYSIELRYLTPKEVIGDIETFSLILGYKIL